MGNSKVKPEGWHSRRHETASAQIEARERYEDRAFGRPPQYWADEGHCWRKGIKPAVVAA